MGTLADSFFERVIPNFRECFYLTKRFHFAVRLFSYRSHMTSKCGKNKKVAHEPLGEWVTNVAKENRPGASALRRNPPGRRVIFI